MGQINEHSDSGTINGPLTRNDGKVSADPLPRVAPRTVDDTRKVKATAHAPRQQQSAKTCPEGHVVDAVRGLNGYRPKWTYLDWRTGSKWPMDNRHLFSAAY